MSHDTTSVGEKEPAPLTTHDDGGKNQRNHHGPESPLIAAFSRFLDEGDYIVYTIVGCSFFLGSFVALGYAFWDFGSKMLLHNYLNPLTPADVATAIIQLVSDLLLVLIIMEVLGTVIHYLKEHATSLRPFLFIGIVSATRGILSIGARLSVNTEVNTDEFTRSMIELGVNAAVILALGITLKLLGKLVDD